MVYLELKNRIAKVFMMRVLNFNTAYYDRELLPILSLTEVNHL